MKKKLPILATNALLNFIYELVSNTGANNSSATERVEVRKLVSRD